MQPDWDKLGAQAMQALEEGRMADAAKLFAKIAAHAPREGANWFNLGYARRCAREEGLLVGISSGAALAAIAQKLPDLEPGARVLGFNYDTGERYLSVPDFLPEA